MGDPRMVDRFVNRFVSIAMLGILAHHGDADFVVGIAAADASRSRQSSRFGLRRVQAQLVADQLIEFVLDQTQRHFVDRKIFVAFSSITASTGTLQNRAIFSRSSRLIGCSVRQISMSGWMPICRNWPTECCVGLVFSSPRRLEVRHQRQVNVKTILLADIERELANRFQEWQAFDVADRAADFGDDHVDDSSAASLARCNALDFVGDVRNHLHGLAQELAAAFLVDDRLGKSARWCNCESRVSGPLVNRS